MRGVDEETLIAVRKSLAAEGLNTDVIDALISLKVRELNPWMTLEEFLKSGFEGDCRIYLRIGYGGIGKFNNNTFSYRYGVIEHESITHVQPIHKPEPPKL